MKRLDETYKRFFEMKCGFPAFKTYGDEPGIRFPDPKQFELDQVNGVACGHTENADVHAAKNILAAGYAVWEAGRASAGESSRTSAQQTDA